VAIAAIVVVYTAVLHIANPTIGALSFLLIVFTAAARSTLRVAIAASVVSTACFNYFFLPPTGSFHIADSQNWFALFTLLAVSVLVSRLSAEVRLRAQDAVARRDELARLFDVTRDILLTTDADDPIAAVASHVARRFQFPRASIFRKAEGAWTEHSGGEPGLQISEEALDRVLNRGLLPLEFDARTRAYTGAIEERTSRGDVVSLVPLRVGATPIGVLALQDEGIEPRTRDAIAGVVAIAIERQQLLDERKEAEILHRSSELRSALLASFSHDLRTPLTAVTVASTNLDSMEMSESARREQVEVIQTEVTRLNRLFENIVEMARIEARAITADPQWVQAAEIIQTARQQLGRQLASHELLIDVDDDSVVKLDPRLMSAAIAHLVENAAQYSPTGSTIEIRGWLEAGEFRMSVRDHGPGISSDDFGRVFDRFYRGASGQHRFGTGMGLAITRGLVAAQGGRVWAETADGGGALLTCAVPSEARSLVGAGQESE